METDQTPRSVASNLGLHYLPRSLLSEVDFSGISSLHDKRTKPTLVITIQTKAVDILVDEILHYYNDEKNFPR